jgi:type II secretory pathway component PulF
MPKKQVIDPLQRLEELFFSLAKTLVSSFQNIATLIIGGVIIVLALLYLFFSLIGLT